MLYSQQKATEFAFGRMGEAMIENQQVVSVPVPQKKGFGEAALSFALSCLKSVLLVLLVTTFLLEPIRVEGQSMRNTLQNGDVMLATKIDYLIGSPDRFDVVICNFPGEGRQRFVKRIVGVPGDVVSIDDGTLMLNGERMEEAYIDFPPNYRMPEVTVGEGHYFVLGDNRASSMDSHIVGLLSRDQILGHVQYVMWPLPQMRAIH